MRKKDFLVPLKHTEKNHMWKKENKPGTTGKWIVVFLLCCGIFVFSAFIQKEKWEQKQRIKLEITADAEKGRKGQLLTFAVLIKNQGAVSVNEILLTCNPQSYETRLANLLPEEGQLFTSGESSALTHIVTKEDEERGYYEMTAKARGETYQGTEIKAEDSLRIPIIH